MRFRVRLSLWGPSRASCKLGPLGWRYDIVVMSSDDGRNYRAKHVAYGRNKLHPGMSWYQFYSRLGGPYRRVGRLQKISSLSEFDLRTFQNAVSRYIDRYSDRQRFYCIINYREIKLCVSTTNAELSLESPRKHL